MISFCLFSRLQGDCLGLKIPTASRHGHDSLNILLHSASNPLQYICPFPLTSTLVFIRSEVHLPSTRTAVHSAAVQSVLAKNSFSTEREQTACEPRQCKQSLCSDQSELLWFTHSYTHHTSLINSSVTLAKLKTLSAL